MAVAHYLDSYPKQILLTLTWLNEKAGNHGWHSGLTQPCQCVTTFLKLGKKKVQLRWCRRGQIEPAHTSVPLQPGTLTTVTNAAANCRLSPLKSGQTSPLCLGAGGTKMSVKKLTDGEQ